MPVFNSIIKVCNNNNNNQFYRKIQIKAKLSEKGRGRLEHRNKIPYEFPGQNRLRISRQIGTDKHNKETEIDLFKV